MANDGVTTNPLGSAETATPLAQMTGERALSLGEEAREIVRLVQARVRGFDGFVIAARSGGLAELERAVAAARRQGGGAAVRPLFATTGAARAFEEQVAVNLDVVDDAGAAELIRVLDDALRAPALRAAFGGARTIPIRVAPFEIGTLGEASSVGPHDGDPDHVGVRLNGRAWYRVERKSGRTVHEGDSLDAARVESLADLVDRCQIVLGRPLSIEWCIHDGRPAIISLRPLRPALTFTDAPLRRVAIVVADEGTVAPLAIDALDRGLCRVREREPGAIATRVYARPYRRLELEGRWLGGPMGAVSSATSAAAKVAYETAVAILADSEFCKAADERVARFDVADLGELDDEELLRAFEERHALVAEAFGRLDSCRELTRKAIVALEIAVGPLPRECYPALSTPKSTRERLRVGVELADLARKIGADIQHDDVRSRLDAANAKRWDELRTQLRFMRPLGIDVVADAIGSSDACLRAALVCAPARKRIDALEEARWSAIRRVLGKAQSQPFGAARAGVVSSVGLVIDRIVTSKGRLAEALAASLGRMREAALEIGRRLVDRASLDASQDALYLAQRELEEALRGEPSGLAARVRARREDDERWRWFDAPRRLRDEGTPAPSLAPAPLT